MNKLFTKIVGVALGLTMAIGVGVAVASNSEAVPVHASDATILTFSSTASSGVNGIAYASYKAGGTSDPALSSNCLRLYQTSSKTDGNLGGVVKFWMADGSKITGFTATFNATNEKVRYGVSDTDKSSGFSSSDFVATDYAVSTSKNMSVTGLNSTYLFIGNFRFTNSNSTQRVDIKTITISYSSAASYTITYKANGGSGTVPSPTTGSGTVTLRNATESSSLTRSGYLLDGWNIESHKEALTADYSLGGSYSLSGDVELYAHWTAVYTVTYQKGDHGSGDDHVVSNVKAGSYELISFTNAGFIAESGYGFTKWKIGSNLYDAGASVTISGNTIVIAQYAEIVVLTYDKNGGTGTNVVENLGKGSSVTVADCTFTAPSGKSFSKWNTKSDGTGTSYTVDQTFTINADTTLYAQWAPVLDITISNFTEITASYTTKFTHEYTVATYNSTTTMDVEAYGVYKNSNGIQMNSGKGTYIKNTEALPTGAYITKIICEWTATGKNSPTIYVAKDAVASTSSKSLGTGSNTVKTQTFTVTNALTNKYNYFYFDGTTVTGACYLSHLTICYDFADEVSSIVVNATQDQLTFTVGDTFTFAGSVTPTRLLSGVGSATTENLTFKLGGDTIIAGSYTFVKADNGKTLNVTYTENGKSVNANAPYNVIVDYAYVETVEINKKTQKLGKVDSFTFGAEVLPSTAQQDVKWSVEDKVGTEVESGNIIIDEDTGELTVLASNGCTITVTATTVGEDENGNTLTDSVDVVISDDPVVVVDDELTGYSGKNTSLAYSFNNFTGTLSVVSSDPNKVTVGTPSARTGGSGSGTVQVNFDAAGSSTLSFKDGDSVIATCKVTVTASTVTSLSWSASNFDVYDNQSLSALPGTLTAIWNNDDITHPTSGYTLAIGGSSISLPHAWSTNDDGKSFTVTYGGQSASVSIQVTEHLDRITETSWTKVTDATTLTAGDKLVIASDSKGKVATDISSQIMGNVDTVFEGGKISGDLDSSAVQLTLGGSSGAWTLQNSAGKYLSATAEKKLAWADSSIGNTWTISISSGDATITFATSSYGKFMYNVSSPRFTTYTSSVSPTMLLVQLYRSKNTPINDTNSTAQRALISFAKTFNTTMACDDSGDTANVASNWSSVSSSFTTTLSGLSSDNQVVLKKLVANASSVEGGDTLQDMLARYDYIVAKYKLGDSDFLHSFAGRGAVSYSRVSTLINITNSTNTVAIIVVISMISVTAIGGYFFLRKRKEN